VGISGGVGVHGGFNIPSPGGYTRTTQTYSASYNRQQPYQPPVGVDPATAQWYMQASQAFRNHDADMNGHLSFPEFEMAMRSLGFPFQSPQHAMQVFQTADLDKSGTLAEREFCEFYVYTKRQPPMGQMPMGQPPMGQPMMASPPPMMASPPPVSVSVSISSPPMPQVGMPQVGMMPQVGVGAGGGFGLNGIVSLRTNHGMYVCAEANHVVIANRPQRAQWEGWMVQPTPDGRVSFRSFHGKFLCAEQNHAVVSNRDALGPWESWTPIPLGGPNYAFRSHHGKFLCAEPSGLVVANRDVQGPWEVFTVEPHRF